MVSMTHYTPPDAARLARVAVALAAKATPGPWSIALDHEDEDHDHIFANQVPGDFVATVDCNEERTPAHDGREDARLIAHAGTHYGMLARALLAEQTRADRAVALLRHAASRNHSETTGCSSCCDIAAFLAAEAAP